MSYKNQKKLIRYLNKLLKVINSKVDEIISLLFARSLFYKINFFIYKKVLISIGINLPYDIHKSGEYEFLNSYLKNLENPIVFDVGANIGGYSMDLKKINKNAIIYAFEPHFKNFKLLQDNLINFKDIYLYNIGLSSEKTKLKIYDYKNMDGSPRASVYKDVIEFMYGSETVEYEIEVNTIDNFVNIMKIKKIDLLKIDVEGHELDVLKGALNTINNGLIDIIQFEFNYTDIISHSFLYDFFKLLPNYEFYRLLRKGKIHIENVAYNEIFLYQNIIAIKKN